MNEISEETVKKKKSKPTHGVPILPIADPIASGSQTSNMTTPKQKSRIIDIKTKQTDSKVGMVKTPSRSVMSRLKAPTAFQREKKRRSSSVNPKQLQVL